MKTDITGALVAEHRLILRVISLLKKMPPARQRVTMAIGSC